jgi:hypothetical protein
VFRRLGIGVLFASLLLVAGCQVQWVADNGVSGGVSCPPIPTAPTSTVTFTCTGSVVPSPSSTVTTSTTTPVITTTTTQTTTTTNTPPSGNYPTVGTTGVPAGTSLTEHAGDLVITTSETYDKLHVTGSLTVKAPNVHVTNSWIEGSSGTEEAVVNNSTGLALSNVTVGKATGCNPQPGIGEANYTADHVRIQGMGDGFRASGSNITVTNSFVQTCDDPNNHDDAFQAYCPGFTCSNITFRHNYLSVYGTRNYTAPLFGGSDPGGSNGQLANSAFDDNLLNGGVFSIYLYGPSLQVSNNKIVDGHWTYAPIDADSCNGFSGNTRVIVDASNHVTSVVGPANCA